MLRLCGPLKHLEAGEIEEMKMTESLLVALNN
jgi:hypothetical protein